LAVSIKCILFLTELIQGQFESWSPRNKLQSIYITSSGEFYFWIKNIIYIFSNKFLY